MVTTCGEAGGEAEEEAEGEGTRGAMVVPGELCCFFRKPAGCAGAGVLAEEGDADEGEEDKEEIGVTSDLAPGGRTTGGMERGGEEGEVDCTAGDLWAGAGTDAGSEGAGVEGGGWRGCCDGEDGWTRELPSVTFVPCFGPGVGDVTPSVFLSVIALAVCCARIEGPDRKGGKEAAG